MTTCLGKSCSYGLLCVSFVNVYQFVYVLLSLCKGENLRHDHLCFKRKKNLGPDDKISYIRGLKGPIFIL